MPHAGTTHLCTTLHGRAYDGLHRVPKGATYEETIRLTED
jgi:hypothetical protein